MSAPGGGPDWSRLERVIAAFERSLRRGQRPPIEAYLSGLDGPERAAALPELAVAELELRRRAGEPATAAEYLGRFPELAGHPDAPAWLRAAESTPLGSPAQGAGPVPAALDSLAGHTLGRFELREEVGRGAFGVVYRAHDAALARDVAVKVLRAGRLAGPREVDRLLREARNAARLAHPGIVPVHEAGLCDGVAYLVSEYVPGTTLDAYGPARESPRAAAELVARVAEALDHAHRNGVVHRDVKPSNILVGADGRPRLTDFGLAKSDGADGRSTRDGLLLGTPAYMSPEQARGLPGGVDARGDVYSLGVVLYELLTGEPPFRGSDRMVLVQLLEDDPRPPRRLRDAIPRDLETVCLKAMAREPGRRYRGAAELADDLRRYLRGEPVHARPLSPLAALGRRCRRQPRVAILAAVLAATILAALGVSSALWLRAEAYRAAAEANLEAARRQRGQALRDLGRAHETISVLIGLEHNDLLRMTTPPDGREAYVRRSIDQFRAFLAASGPGDDPTLQDQRSNAAWLIADLSSLTEPASQAIRAWREAIELTRPLVAADPGRFEPRERLASAYLHLAMAHYTAIDPAAAEAAVARGIDCWAARPGAPALSARERWTSDRTLGGLHQFAGKLRLERGRPAEALRCFETALAWRARAAALQPPGHLLSRADEAESRTEIARALRALGRLAEARDECRRALDAWEAIAAARPVGEVESRLRLAECRFLAGAIAYDADDAAGALEHHRAAAATFAAVPRNHLRRPIADAALGAAHHNIGRALVGLGRTAEAVDAFREAIAVRDELARSQPLSPDRWSDLGGTWAWLAKALLALGRRDEAADACRAAIDHQRHACDLAPGAPRYRELLADHAQLRARLE